MDNIDTKRIVDLAQKIEDLQKSLCEAQEELQRLIRRGPPALDTPRASTPAVKKQRKRSPKGALLKNSLAHLLYIKLSQKPGEVLRIRDFRYLGDTIIDVPDAFYRLVSIGCLKRVGYGQYVMKKKAPKVVW